MGTTSPTSLTPQSARAPVATQRTSSLQAGATATRGGGAGGRSASGEDTHGDNPYTTYGDLTGGGHHDGLEAAALHLHAEDADEVGEFEVRDRATGGGGRSSHVTILHRDERERPSRGRRRSGAEDGATGNSVEGVIARSLHEGRERLSSAAAAIMGFAHLGRTSRHRTSSRGVNAPTPGSAEESRPGSGTVAVVVPTFEDDVRQ